MSRPLSLGGYIYNLVFRYKFYFLSYIFLSFATGIFEISVDYKVKELIDTLTHRKLENLSYLVCLFIGYKFFFHFLHFLVRVLDLHYRPKMNRRVMSDLYQNMIDHSLPWFDKRFSGDICSKISDFRSSFSTLIYNIHTLGTVSSLGLSTFFMFKVSSISGAIFSTFILVYTPIIYYLFRKQSFLYKDTIEHGQKALAIINDSVINMSSVKMISRPQWEFLRHISPALKLWQQKEKKSRAFDAFIVDNTDTVLMLVMNTVQILSLISLYKGGSISAGDFAFVAMITLKVHTQLDYLLETILFNVNPAIAQLRAGYQLIFDPKDREEANLAPPKQLAYKEGRIQYQNISFGYGNQPLFRNFSLEIFPGEKIAIAGLSGAGKTTLTKFLLRYYDPWSGQILLDGQDISQVSKQSLRDKISLIPQNVTMFHRSLYNNLTLANPRATQEDIQRACKIARIHEDIMAMPDGYHTLVGEQGARLSGGQKQRIAIARAIIKNAPILILDEATSSLDTETEAIIQESLDELFQKKEMTVIAIAHRLSTIKHMDRILVLHQGKIQEQGTHETLIQNPQGLYKNLWHKNLY